MPKLRRNPLSEILGSAAAPAPLSLVSEAPPAPMSVPGPTPVAATAAPATRSRSSTKDRTVQQAVYLPPAVYEQLRELAFSERAKMHDFYHEGLDAVFRKRGLKSIAELTGRK